MGNPTLVVHADAVTPTPTPPSGAAPHTPAPGMWERESVAVLMENLDPQYRIEGLNDDGAIDPNWRKIERFADLMRTGRFDYDASPITMLAAPGGSMVFDGNHRVLAADLADITHLPVWYTDRPFG